MHSKVQGVIFQNTKKINESLSESKWQGKRFKTLHDPEMV